MFIYLFTPARGIVAEAPPYDRICTQHEFMPSSLVALVTELSSETSAEEKIRVRCRKGYPE
jgi:hypothetical protein